MGISESEERLREYVEKDIIYQDYKKSNKEPSDFERFCFVHCRDIENVLNENQQLKSVLDEIREYIEDDGISYLDLVGTRCWCNKQSANKLLQILDKVKE